MGEKLLGQVTEATGLPQELVADELTRLLQRAGVGTKEFTLEDLRQVLADYMQDVLLSAKEEQAAKQAPDVRADKTNKS